MSCKGDMEAHGNRLLSSKVVVRVKKGLKVWQARVKGFKGVESKTRVGHG